MPSCGARRITPGAAVRHSAAMSRAGIEIIGMISTTLASELYGRSIISGAVDPDFIAKFARVHEEGGFDRVLVGYGSSGADGFAVTAHAAAATTRLGFLIAHRPGFVAPTLAARKAATLDHVTGGRIALHIITGGNDVEQQRDGDFLDHDARYRRTDEYLHRSEERRVGTGCRNRDLRECFV